MPSRIAEALSLRYPPLGFYYASEAPAGAKSFKQGGGKSGGWGCVMFLLAQAAKGETVAFSQETCLCPGASGGLGLGRVERDFPGGREAFPRFLSCGNKHWAEGRAAAEQMKAAGASESKLEEYLEGEGFKKTPELALRFIMDLPVIEPEAPFVVIKPLADGPPPKTVILLADAEQLSALVVLANYGRAGENVRIPFGAGCQSIGQIPLYEAARDEPKAVVGLTDISARLYLRKLMGRDLLSFTVPWSFYQEMEDNVESSFLSRLAWKELRRD